MNKGNLIMLTNAYPYGDWEAYLETETNYYDNFDEIKIFSLQTRKEMLATKRNINHKNVKSYPIEYLSRFSYLIKSIPVLFDGDFYKELGQLIKGSRFSISALISLFVYMSRAKHELKEILKHVEKNDFENSLIYSYRFEYQPYIAIKLKEKFNKNIKIICRAHGGDLYEYRRSGDYIPFRPYILENIDKLFTVSKDGADYLMEKYPGFENKISYNYLGTLSDSPVDYDFSDKVKILSCSRVKSVKRIDKIINALAILNNTKIIWHHYGDGEIFDEIKKIADEKLTGKVQYEFMGAVDNKELLEIYKNGNYHFFLNTSSSEGIPVSIMEASSFGIPCLATDVGGTREIIKNGENGILLDSDIKDEELAREIQRFISLDKESYLEYREKARIIWQENFDATRNYKEFSEMLEKLI